MTTPITVINLGLSKIAGSRVSTISPPKTALERYMAANYPAWRDAELARRRWVFAMEWRTLTLQETLTSAAKPYKYGIPNDALRAIRNRDAEWEQRRRFIYSAQATLTVPFIIQVPENEFDPLFVEVLACKIAHESAEYVTQSNTKKDKAEKQYDLAVLEAGRNNAFTRGSDDETDEGDEDTEFDWITKRYEGG